MPPELPPLGTAPPSAEGAGLPAAGGEPNEAAGGEPNDASVSAAGAAALSFSAAADAAPPPLLRPLSRSVAHLGVGLKTFRALLELERREITPEDFELLSRLHDDSNTVVFTAAEVEAKLPIFELQHDLSHGAASCCIICMEGLESGERVRVLPCSEHHAFHASCISEWLTRSSVCCPLDGEDLRAALRPRVVLGPSSGQNMCCDCG